MRTCLRSVCLWFACLLAMPAAWGGGDGASTGSQPSPSRPALDRVLDRLGESPNMLSLKAALEQMQRAYPDRLRMDCYGQSRQGRALYRLRILPWDSELARVKAAQPALILTPRLTGLHRPLPLLRAVARQLEAGGPDRNMEWIVYPLPDPDPWVDGPGDGVARGRVRLDRNFPEGWLPWTGDLGHPGHAPLSEPETRNLALSLAQVPGAVAMVLLGPDGGGPLELGSPGSLESHGRGALKLPVWSLAEVSRLQATIQRVEQTRPKLEVRTVLKKRLSVDLHLVEVHVRNGGGGTATLGDVALGVTGATCLKRAWTRSPGEPHQLLESTHLPELRPGADGIRVRLVLRVTDPESLVLHFDSPRVSGVTVALPPGNLGTDSK